MATKIFNEKKIQIRQLSEKDLEGKRVKQFQDFVNSLVEEDAQIRVHKKQSLREERDWLERKLKGIRKRKKVVLFAEHNGLIVGNVGVGLEKGRNDHIAKFWIAIREGYRGIGLGSYLAEEIIKLAKEELRPKPKIIELMVYTTNQGAIKFYRRLGFKKVAIIPYFVQYKGKLISEIIMFLHL